MAKSNFFQSYYIDPTGARWEVPQISEENQRSFIRSVLELPDQRPRTTVHDTVEDDVDDEVIENDNVSASAQSNSVNLSLAFGQHISLVPVTLHACNKVLFECLAIKRARCIKIKNNRIASSVKNN